MKKPLLLLILLAAQIMPSFARQVNEQAAKTIAQNFWVKQFRSDAGNMTLIYKLAKENSTSENCLYVFNSDKGFVVVAADDNCLPVLGYSDESVFSTNNISPEVKYMLDFYKKEISFIVAHAIKASEKIHAQWSSLIKSTPVMNLAKTTGIPVVKPLALTLWNQSPYYNTMCPFDSLQNRRSITGCVATAMAQVMKFWNYPATGTSTHSYVPGSNPQYGVLTANFGNTNYQWTSMPNTISSNNTAIGTLMYHAGVSVDMDYTPDFSGAWVISYNQQNPVCSENAFQQYFGYRNDIKGLQRDDYTTAEWLRFLKTELNASRPMIYVGYSFNDGHAFVADGYDNNDLFHINWGWGGNYNGYFSVDAMDPSSAPGYNFDLFQEILMKIEPANPAVAMDLNAAINVPAVVVYNHPFTVKADLINHGSASFNGDYAARVFDLDGNIVDSIQVMSGNTLTAGNQTGTLSFATTGLATMVPGNYVMGIFYRPAGKTWFEARENNNYTNMIPVTVIATAGINEIANTGSMQLYPNPASDVLHIQLDKSHNGSNVQLTDAQGRVLYSLDNCSETTSLSLKSFAQGLYFVTLKTNNGVQTQKFIIKR